MIKGNKKIVSIIIVIILACIIGAVVYVKHKDTLAKDAMSKGISALNKGNYKVAKSDMNTVLNEDKNDEKAKDIVNIINEYEKAKSDFKENKLEEANKDLEGIPNSYLEYGIKSDIEGLKDNIEDKIEDIKEIDTDLNKIDISIKSKDYNKAMSLINDIDKEDATPEQIDKLNNYKQTTTDAINKVKRQEAERKAEEAKKAKDETAIVNTGFSGKALTAGKVSKNSKPVNTTVSSGLYVNTKLGLEMNFPANWEGKYKVQELSNGGIAILLNLRQANFPEEGLFFTIQKKSDAGLEDSSRTINANGIVYEAGTPTDVSISGNNPQASEWFAMNRQISEVIQSIRAIG